MNSFTGHDCTQVCIGSQWMDYGAEYVVMTTEKLTEPKLFSFL